MQLLHFADLVVQPQIVIFMPERPSLVVAGSTRPRPHLLRASECGCWWPPTHRPAHLLIALQHTAELVTLGWVWCLYANCDG